MEKANEITVEEFSTAVVDIIVNFLDDNQINNGEDDD